MDLEEEMAEGLANSKGPTDRMTCFFEHKATNLELLRYACVRILSCRASHSC